MPYELSKLMAVLVVLGVCISFISYGLGLLRNTLNKEKARGPQISRSGYGRWRRGLPDENRSGYLIAASILASAGLLCAALTLVFVQLERPPGEPQISEECSPVGGGCPSAPESIVIQPAHSPPSFIVSALAWVAAAAFFLMYVNLDGRAKKSAERLTFSAVFLAVISGSLVPVVELVQSWRAPVVPEPRPRVAAEPQWVVLPVMTASDDRPRGAPLLVVYFDNEKTAIEEGAQLAGLDLTLKAIAACVKGAEEAVVMIRVAGFASSSEWLNDQGDTRADSDASNLELARLRAEFLVSEMRAAADRAGVSSQIKVEPVSWNKSFQRMARARPFIDRTDSLGGPSGAERLNQIAIAYIDPENDCAP